MTDLKTNKEIKKENFKIYELTRQIYNDLKKCIECFCKEYNTDNGISLMKSSTIEELAEFADHLTFFETKSLLFEKYIKVNNLTYNIIMENSEKNRLFYISDIYINDKNIFNCRLTCKPFYFIKTGYISIQL